MSEGHFSRGDRIVVIVGSGELLSVWHRIRGQKMFPNMRREGVTWLEFLCHKSDTSRDFSGG